MGAIKAAAVAFLIGAVLGAGIAGYIAWTELRDARADVADARGNLDAAREQQREAQESALRIAQRLQEARGALRASRARVDALERIFADSGTELDSLGVGIETARDIAREDALLLAQLREELERLGANTRARPP